MKSRHIVLKVGMLIFYSSAILILGFKVNWWCVLGIFLFGTGMNLEKELRGRENEK